MTDSQALVVVMRIRNESSAQWFGVHNDHVIAWLIHGAFRR